jgi:hypothetical protein
MTEVSDDDIRQRLREILKVVDLDTTTERQLREQIQKHFGCGDLKSKKSIFSEEIEAFLRSREDDYVEGDDDAEVDPDGDAELDDEEPKKRKRSVGGCVHMSEELLEFLDVGPDEKMTRSDVVKQLWAYSMPRSFHNIISCCERA